MSIWLQTKRDRSGFCLATGDLISCTSKSWWGHSDGEVLRVGSLPTSQVYQGRKLSLTPDTTASERCHAAAERTYLCVADCQEAYTRFRHRPAPFGQHWCAFFASILGLSLHTGCPHVQAYRTCRRTGHGLCRTCRLP